MKSCGRVGTGPLRYGLACSNIRIIAPELSQPMENFTGEMQATVSSPVTDKSFPIPHKPSRDIHERLLCLEIRMQKPGLTLPQEADNLKMEG